MEIDFNKIKVENKNISVENVVTRFSIENYRNLEPFYIDIMQSKNLREPFYGKCEFSFWGPEQALPYHPSLHPQETVEEAFNVAFRSFTSFDNPSYPNTVVFFQKYSEDGKTTFFDGNGDTVSKEEIEKRRKEYKSE